VVIYFADTCMSSFIERVHVVVYVVGTCRGLYSRYMSWFIKRVHVVVVYIAGTRRGLFGGYRLWFI
jgi:hypothetical protein